MATEQTDAPVVAQQPVITDESNTKTVTGFSALTLPTPDRIKAIFKMITFFTVVATVALNGISDIPLDTKRHISEYILVLVLILQKAEDFWGIQLDQK